MIRPAAIVTGGARGIGLACAEALADAGFDILVADLAETAADGLAADITGRGAKFAYVPCDIADLASHAALVDAAISAFGRIDCLVNNAGVGAVVRGDLLELKPENFDRAIGINLRGTVFLSQAVAKAMLAAPADSPRSIITITSVSAEMASPERSDYCISKAGLSMWVKNLALRLAAENIGVFELRPGIIRTDMTAGVAAKYDALIDGGLVPAKRWGEASDIGAVVATLAGGKLGFSTGSIINVDGALSVPRL
ncbi:3-ketoacyl-ACP reductase [Mesorhizobium qingshengii]|uniref:3-ketoacyl-ACP reductase n=1 Tax=Mesorhizobium qingshengii TaxID=1165689 RepID=A0ABT4QS67_9HYPH|nr:3-ketoacyl-ACP reductase [Mesorhizobium qingshengii]MCZ8544354.1 3-ketoacyl-ACP reductase [Mesorhizobium qingshengii]